MDRQQEGGNTLMNRREILFGGAALAATKLTDAQLDGVTAGYQTSPGAPFSQQPVKGIPNVVKGKGGAVVVNPKGGAVVVKGKK
jgi:hypothetical protein